MRMSMSTGYHFAPVRLWGDGSSCLVTGRPNPPGGTPSSICRIKSGESVSSLVAFHKSDPYPARATFAGPDSWHKSLRIGSLGVLRPYALIVQQ